MFRALVFDFDGTILDTELPDFISWQEIYREHGHQIPVDAWANRIGGAGDGFDPFAHLEALTGLMLDREAIRVRRRRRNLELVEAQAVRPGVQAYLAAAAQLGLRLAIASSSPRAWVEGHLTRLGLLHCFPVRMTADDVRYVKPNPELYHAAVEALDVAPDEAIAIEDSHNGMLAARGAGLFCVVCPNELTRNQSFELAHLRVDSLAQIPLSELLRLLASRRASHEGAG